MFGMEMMLKSMGLDPKEILESVNKFGQTFLAMQEQMTRIEHKLDAVLTQNLLSEIASTSETETERTIDHE